MLNNDVFFLYPPGYSGNYLQWIIHASEAGTASTTVMDPLLEDGTTHGFIRKPTHLTFIKTIKWLIKNQPVKPQTYIINVNQQPSEWWISHSAWISAFLLHAKPNCRIVNIYADGDDEVKFGALNTYTKWPTYFEVRKATDLDFVFPDVWGASKEPIIEDRNHFYKHWRIQFPINIKNIYPELNFHQTQFNEWYRVRNRLQPWEVNESEYTVFDQMPIDQILNISLKDIIQDNFISEIYKPWLDKQKIGDFNFKHAIDYHQNYIQAQYNSKWFDSIRDLRELKIINPFLLKTSLAQAFVLEELGPLDRGWEEQTTVDILNKHGYNIINT